jgi:ATP-binding cassette, subfamily A (ABC1), member 3
MTTREHLEFYASVKGVASVQQDVDTLMRKVGLEEYESRLASTLSGGKTKSLDPSERLRSAHRESCYPLRR